MKKITLLFCYVFLFGIISLQAQNISVVATGFTGPIGICKDNSGNLFVAETGTGNNDGKIILVDPSGNKHTIVYGLPSHMDTATHETAGPWRPYITPDSLLWVIVGSGPDTSAGSIMQFDLSTVTPGVDSLTITDTTKIYRIQAWALSHGYSDSDIFSAVWDASGNIYTADAGANAVLKIDAAGNISTLDTFPAIPNTFTPFPPYIDYVPTKIISDNNGGFYLCNLTGFPFLSGLAEIVMLDTAGMMMTMYTGLTQAVDMEMDSHGNLYVLQFGLYDSSFFPVPNSASIIRISPTGAMDTLATGFGPSAGMVPDSSDGFYVTELFTGNLIHISNTTAGISTLINNVNELNAYPNPFSESFNINYSLNETSVVTYTITDQIGNRVFFKNAGILNKGKNGFSFETKSLNNFDLSSGIYFLTVTAGNSKQTISLLKK